MATSSNVDEPMEDQQDSEILKIREFQREAQRALRKCRREVILNQNRHLLVVPDSTTYTDENVKELGIKFVRTKEDLINLHQIKIAVKKESQIEAFLKVPGALEKLVGKLCGNSAQEQLDAALCFTNLATGSHGSVFKIAKAAGAYLITHMRGNSNYLQNQCAWAAGNIAIDCDKCCAILVAQGLLPALEHLLKSPYPEVIESAMFALNASTLYPSKDFEYFLERDLIDLLLRVANGPDISHRATCELFSIIAHLAMDIIRILPGWKQLSIISALLAHLERVTIGEKDKVAIAVPILRCLGFFSSVSSQNCELILNHSSFLTCAKKIIMTAGGPFHREAIWVLNNVLASSKNTNDWSWLLTYLRPMLTPLDEYTVQVLYLLCTLTTKADFKHHFLISDLPPIVTMLCGCGNLSIEMAAKAFCSICEAL